MSMPSRGKKYLVFYIGTQKCIALWGEGVGKEARVFQSAINTSPQGFLHGCISDIEKAAQTLLSLVDTLAGRAATVSASDILAEDVYVVLGNPKLKTYTFSSCQYYHGARRTISPQDVRAVIEQTKSVATLPLLEYVLEVSPVSFLVNDLENVTDPVGLESERLGVTLKIFTMEYKEYRNIAKAFETAEIEVNGYFPRMLTSSEAVLNEKEKTEGTILVDLGSEAAYFSLWRRGELVNTRILPMGACELVHQTAKKWGIELHDALKVVGQYGALSKQVDYGDELIPLVIRESNEKYQVSRSEFHEHFLSGAVQWMEKILNEADLFLKEANLLYPHLVFCGSGTQMDGFLDFIQQHFSRDARIGLSHGVEAPHELKIDPYLVPAMGMYRWIGGELQERQKMLESRSLVEKTFQTAKEWFAAYF